MLEQIEYAERRIVSLSSVAVLMPGEEAPVLRMKEIDSKQTEQDFAKAMAVNNNDVEVAMTNLMKPHDDVCRNTTFAPARSAEAIYANIKKLLDTFDIYSKCTKTYMKRVPIQKDDVVAISTELAAGMFGLSYEDVAQYKEAIELQNEKPVKTLTLIVSSRKENVIEGNYDVEVSLDEGMVILKYTKRQNLAEKVLEMGISRNSYAIKTQRSVDSTLHKLAYAGLYGPDAVSDGGCYTKPNSKCAEYNTFESGEECQYDLQCQSNKCNDHFCD